MPAMRLNFGKTVIAIQVLLAATLVSHCAVVFWWTIRTVYNKRGPSARLLLWAAAESVLHSLVLLPAQDLSMLPMPMPAAHGTAVC
jgi:hypothetical protein